MTMSLSREAAWGDGARRLRQIQGILRLELRKVLFSPWALIGWGLALLPVSLLGLRALVFQLGWAAPNQAPSDAQIFAIVYETLILRLCLFFGCLAIFINLFRGEIHERTLHYYLLAPLRRDVLVLGKYLGGLSGAALLFGGSVLATRLLIAAAHPGAEINALLGGNWLAHSLGYLTATLLACAVYGALFLLIGLLPVNPIIPALLLLAWESASLFLPETLQRLSAIHYLSALLPVPISIGPIAILGTPPPAPVAFVALIVIVLAALGGAMRLARRVEAGYGEE